MAHLLYFHINMLKYQNNLFNKLFNVILNYFKSVVFSIEPNWVGAMDFQLLKRKHYIAIV